MLKEKEPIKMKGHTHFSFLVTEI